MKLKEPWNFELQEITQISENQLVTSNFKVFHEIREFYQLVSKEFDETLFDQFALKERLKNDLESCKLSSESLKKFADFKKKKGVTSYQDLGAYKF